MVSRKRDAAKAGGPSGLAGIETALIIERNPMNGGLPHDEAERLNVCGAQRRGEGQYCTEPHDKCARHCGAKTRSGGCCGIAPKPNGRCDRHGGKSIGGVDHWNFKDGSTSRYFPRGNLAQRYNKSHDRGTYTELRDEIALTTGMINQVLLEDSVPQEKQRSEALKLINHRRRLVDSEAKRLERERQWLTLEQVMMRDAIFMSVLKELLTDEQLIRIRSRLAERLGVM